MMLNGNPFAAFRSQRAREPESQRAREIGRICPYGQIRLIRTGEVSSSTPGWTLTSDLFFRKELLYTLSYGG